MVLLELVNVIIFPLSPTRTYDQELMRIHLLYVLVGDEGIKLHSLWLNQGMFDEFEGSVAVFSIDHQL